MNRSFLVVLFIAILIFVSAFYLSQRQQFNQSDNSLLTITSTDNSAFIPSIIDNNPVQKNFDITIVNFTFEPSVLNINKGDTVTWTNQDTAAHHIKGTTFESGDLATGQSYSFTFTDTGSFDYICIIHTSMSGNIKVQ